MSKLTKSKELIIFAKGSEFGRKCYEKKVRKAIESIEDDMSYASSILALKKLRNILGIDK